MELNNMNVAETDTSGSGKLQPKKVKIMDVEIKVQPIKDGKEKPVLTLRCKHPDREETIEIRKVKSIKNEKLEVEGLWINLNEKNEIQRGSALARMLIFFGLKNPKELKGKEIETTTNEANYLVIKAY